jgi:hypothetical protein
MSPEGNSSDESKLRMQDTNLGWPCPHKRYLSNIQLRFRGDGSVHLVNQYRYRKAMELFLNLGKK